MAPAAADRNLLLGILAYQMDFVTRDALFAAMNSWIVRKETPLGALLLERGDLAASRRQLLEALVDEHIRAHGGDPARSLQALTSVGPVAHDLTGVADGDLQASIGLLKIPRTQSIPPGEASIPPDADPFATCRPGSLGLPTAWNGRFRIVRPHAAGGLGVVSVALDDELDREVAFKEIRPAHADHSGSRARFVLEAEITGKLEHPGIIPIYGLGSAPDGRPFYAMRMIRGDSLADAINRFHDPDGPYRDPAGKALQLRELLGRFLDVCDALAYAHSRGVLHRDLKPGNVMLGPFGETLVVDWGLALPLERIPEGHESTHGAVTSTKVDRGSLPSERGEAIGTAAYMPPEQAEGDLERLGPRSDVYGLGAILYELLTGKPPVEGRGLEELLKRVRLGDIRPPRQVRPETPPALEAICLKALQLRPEDRYPTPRALAADVKSWLADEPISIFRDPAPKRLARWARGHRWAVRTAATLALLLPLGLTTAIIVQRAHARRDTVEAKALADRNLSKAQAIDARRASEEREQVLARQLNNFSTHVAAYNFARASRTDHRPGATSRALEALWIASRRHHLSGDSRRTPVSVDPMNLRREIAECLGEAEIGQYRDPEGRIFFDHPIKALALSGDGGRVAVVLAPASGIDTIRTVRIVRFRKGVTLPGESHFELGAELRWGEANPPGRWFRSDGPRLEPRDVARGLRNFVASRLETARELAISPDGRWVALGTSAGDLYLWDLDDARPGRPPARWRAHDGLIHGLAFGHDSRTLTSSGADRQLIRWSLAGGAGVLPVEAARQTASSRVGRLFTLDGNKRLFAVRDGRLCEFADPGLECRNAGLDMSKYRPDVIALSPDGRFVAAATDAGVEIISAEDGVRMRSLPDAPPENKDHSRGNTSALQFGPDGLHLLETHAGSSYPERGCRVWEIASGREIFIHGSRPGEDLPTSFTPDGGHLFRVDHRPGLRQWVLFAHPVTPAIARATFAVTSQPAKAVALSADGATLACASAGRNEPSGLMRYDVTLWDASDGRLLRRRLIEGVTRSMEDRLAIAFDPGGGRLAVVEPGGVILWEFAANDEPRRIATGKVRPFHAFPREGRLWGSIADADGDRLVILDLAGEVPRPIALDPETDRIPGGLVSRNICFPVGSGLALVGTQRGTVEVFRDDARPARIDSWLDIPGGAAQTPQMSWVAASPDGTRVAAGNYSGQIVLMRSPGGEVIGVAGEHARGFSSLVFSPDGRRLASGSADGTVRLWRVGETGLRDPIVLAGSSVAVGFGPEGRRLWIWSPQENAVQCWDLEQLDGSLMGLDERLAAFLEGEATPVNATESLDLAAFAYEQGLHAASSGLYERAFVAEPSSTQVGLIHRYNAACAAALAGSGRGKDDPMPDGATRTRLRAKARAWLRDDLSALAELLDRGEPRILPFSVEFLSQWKSDPDLGGIRDAAKLVDLPEAERKAIRALWTDFDALLEKATESMLAPGSRQQTTAAPTSPR